MLYISSYNLQKYINKSILYFRENSGISFTASIVLNTPNNNNKNNLIIVKKDLNTNIVEDNNSFVDHPPTRWFLDLKSQVCIFLDYDILTMSNVYSLIDLCYNTNTLCGVLAYKCKIKKDLFHMCFEQCGVFYKECRETWIDKVSIPKYYNYGVLAVPKHIVHRMRGPLKDNIKKINDLANSTNDKELKRHTGQIALAVTIEKLKIPTTDLDIKYNYPSFLPYNKSMVFYHNLTKN